MLANLRISIGIDQAADIKVVDCILIVQKKIFLGWQSDPCPLAQPLQIAHRAVALRARAEASTHRHHLTMKTAATRYRSSGTIVTLSRPELMKF